MFDLTSLDQRYTEHERRVSRIDQDGWKRPSRVALVRSFRARLVETALLPGAAEVAGDECRCGAATASPTGERRHPIRRRRSRMGC